MNAPRFFKGLLVTVLVFLAGIFILFYRMDHNDTQILADFPAAYQNYDLAMSAYSSALALSTTQGVPVMDGLEQKVEEAQTALESKASARISSLTLHDGDLMRVMVEIGDLSKKELAALKAYHQAAADKSSAQEQLSKDLADLTKQRKADFARFRALAGAN